MLPKYLRYVLFTYLANIVRRAHRRHPSAADLVEWVRENAGLLELDEDEMDLPDGRSGSTPSESVWRRLRQLVERERRALSGASPDVPARRLASLGDMIGLSDDDTAILDVLLRYETDPTVEDLVDTAFSSRRARFRQLNLRGSCLPHVLGMSPKAVCRRFAPGAPLARSGLVKVDDDQDVACASRLHRLVSEADRRRDVRELLLGDVRESELVWSDFDHLGQDREDVERLLRGAGERRAHGVNILIHGPPGTGKTEFCRVLARRLGARLFSVGEADEYGGEPTRGERLAELRLAQCLLGEDENAVLLFDEMEDLLADPGFGSSLMGFPRPGRPGGFQHSSYRGGGSKVFMNRLLEETPAPTLWTTNDARSINPAILRRMMFALEMRQPPPRIRALIWARQLAQHDIEATEDDAAGLAHEFDATPGVAAGATAAANLAGGEFETVRRGVRSLSRVLGCDRPAPAPAVRFDPALIDADLDVGDLANRLQAGRQRRLSLCLQGPPGSGKSAYVRYLAERIGLEVLHMRTSDLLSMWVGGTEANIAAAFAEARDNDAFLVFDEADSLLADRRGAHRNWEVNQVNEMLTWMESHPLPFACTTNFGERLDSAALRRFVFKVTLGFLQAEAAVAAFRSFFNLEPPPDLAALAVLTPGDFEVVRRKAQVLGQTDDAAALTAMLRAECDAKPGHAAAVGFGA